MASFTGNCVGLSPHLTTISKFWQAKEFQSLQPPSCLHSQLKRCTHHKGTITAGRKRTKVATTSDKASSPVRTLLIDNYDSYTYNLYQLLAKVNGVAPTVTYNNEVAWQRLKRQLEDGEYDCVVISPGPGTPCNPADIGVCLDVLEHATNMPILGVCLGMQALALVHGGQVVRAPEPVHGRLSVIQHTGDHKLFEGIISGEAMVVRYHSLAVDRTSLPLSLRPLAWTQGNHIPLPQGLQGPLRGPQGAPLQPVPLVTADRQSSGTSAAQTAQLAGYMQQGNVADLQAGSQAGSQQQSGVLMALEHREQPHYGVQFHPESVGTVSGEQLLNNFRDLTLQHLQACSTQPSRICSLANSVQRREHSAGDSAAASGTAADAGKTGVAGSNTLANGTASNTTVGGVAESCVVAVDVSSDSSRNGSNAQNGGLAIQWARWGPGDLGAPAGTPLDSERIFEALFGTEGQTDTFWLDSADQNRGRFSYMGGPGGPLWHRLEYNMHDGTKQTTAVIPQTPSTSSVGATQQRTAANQQTASTGTAAQRQGPFAGPQGPGGTLSVVSAAGQTDSFEVSVLFEPLEQLLQQLQLPAGSNSGSKAASSASEQLPFDFWGGLVGYLGYELKAECGAEQRHCSTLPDAVMFVADRIVAIDHHQNTIYAVALYHQGPSGAPQGPSVGPLANTILRNRQTATQAAAVQWIADVKRTVKGALGPSAGPFGALASTGRANGAKRLRNGQQIGTAKPVNGQHVRKTAVASSNGKGNAQNGKLQNGNVLNGNVGKRNVQNGNGKSSNGNGKTSTDGALDGAKQYAPYQQNSVSQKEPVSAVNGSAVNGKIQGNGNVQGNGISQWEGWALRESRNAYLSNVAACKEALYAGESYELCLTTQLQRKGPLDRDPWALYRALRRINPAPYAAWLRFGGPSGGPTVCCSSPERFLRGCREGVLEAKPIKGTAARASDPAQDAARAAALQASDKDRAENLMIVDLLRNDLGRVCEPGSVHVPALMALESYPTVHQLVSTVRGKRKKDKSLIDCVRAAFPGGSMTGAPKLRSMALLDEIEGGPRGVYSGAIGYFSVNNTMDLNIVIRTAVVGTPGPQGPPGTVTVGAGGAIVVQSDPESEFDEMLLKARALVMGVEQGVLESATGERVDFGEGNGGDVREGELQAGGV